MDQDEIEKILDAEELKRLEFEEGLKPQNPKDIFNDE